MSNEPAKLKPEQQELHVHHDACSGDAAVIEVDRAAALKNSVIIKYYHRKRCNEVSLSVPYNFVEFFNDMLKFLMAPRPDDDPPGRGYDLDKLAAALRNGDWYKYR